MTPAARPAKSKQCGGGGGSGGSGGSGGGEKDFYTSREFATYFRNRY